ncbi:MAG: SCP2 sterol-binding domain-containing protein [Bacteroidia bacterium]|nr:SCP2 sterol-binding domain-containing protein [Bacteroidia bacterium]MDW8332634.1 SCP2 sterol-binding domain-containing protein [Bacteroidia bacterium]
MSLQDLTERIRQKVGNDSGLNATVKFVLSDAESIYIDASKAPNVVSNDNGPADCVIKVSAETIRQIMDGETSAMSAFMSGKIKVEGNMAVAMNINKVL